MVHLFLKKSLHQQEANLCIVFPTIKIIFILQEILLVQIFQQ